MFDNVGPLERKLRIIIGLALIGAGFAVPILGQWHLVSISIGITVLFPAAFGFCPFKAMLLRRLS